jgi:hypothetical protein
MAESTGFFGGLSSGIGEQMTQNLEERKQQELERQRHTVEVQKQIDATIQQIGEIAKQATAAGKDPKQVYSNGAVQTLVRSAQDLAQSIGQDPTRIGAMAQLVTMQSAPKQDSKFSVVHSTDTMGNKFPSHILDETSGTMKPVGGGVPQAPSPVAPGVPMSSADTLSPSQTANATPNQRVASAFGGNVQTDAVPAPKPTPTIPGQLTQDAKRLMAEQLLAGNTSVMAGLGLGKNATATRNEIRNMAAQIAAERGLSAEDMNNAAADFMGMKAGSSSLGRRESGVVGAIMGAAKTAPRVLEASDLVDRSRYKDINKIIMAGKERTGDENVVKFGIAVNTFINNYARAVGAGNSQLTDSARHEAMQNLQLAWSKGQIKAAIDQMNLELESELQGAHEARKSFLTGSALKAAGNKDAAPKPDAGKVIDYREYFK